MHNSFKYHKHAYKPKRVTLIGLVFSGLIMLYLGAHNALASENIDNTVKAESSAPMSIQTPDLQSTPAQASSEIGETPPIVPPALDKKQIKEIKAVLKQVLIDDQETRTLIHAKKQSASELQGPEFVKQIEELWAKQAELDTQNQSIVANILENHGWPKQENFRSSDVAHTLFMVVQHASIEFQERFFPMMQQATERGDIPTAAFAQLHDSILVGKGEKQRYGTQIKVNPDTGTPFFYPIADPRNVDSRRAAVGLEPLAQYAELYNVKYLSEYKSEPDASVGDPDVDELLGTKETEKK